MLRYRRYRVFLILAVIAVFLLYQYGQGSEWDTEASKQYVRQHLGLRGGSSDESIREELKSVQQEDGQLPMQFDNKDAASLPPNTGNLPRPPPQKLPADAVQKDGPTDMDADALKPNPGASLPDKTKEKEKDASQRQRIQSGGTEPITEPYVPSEGGTGRKDIEQEGLNAEIHYTKTQQHFPLSSTIALPAGTPKAPQKIQFAFPADDKDGQPDEHKLGVIKEAFQHAWKGYKEKAYGQDEIRPMTGNSRNPFNGWGATLIDSLDSLWIMGLKDEFEEAVKYVGAVDFTTSPRADIPVFETTIRYLGGLLAAYDISEAKYPVLLEKAQQLGDVLYGAFDTPNRMPMLFFDWKPAFASQIHRASAHAVMSELGSLSLEFTRLAQLTKENKYYDAIARITNAFQEWQANTQVPGLWPIHLDASGCERVQYSTPTKQQDGDNELTRLDGSSKPAGAVGDKAKVPVDDKNGPKVAPGDQPDPSRFAVEGANTAPNKLSQTGPDGAAQSDKSDTFIPLKDPEPIVFKSGPQAGKVAQIQQIDADAGATHGDIKEGVASDQRQATNAAAALDKDADASSDSNPKSLPGGKVGRIQYLEVGADGKERPREDMKNKDRDTTGSLEESTDPMDAAVAGMYSKNYGSHEKRSLGKRQVLEHKEDEGPMGTIPVPPKDNSNPTGEHATTDQQICKERGLASCSKYGMEEFSLGSMADSTYEYLPKEYALLGGLNKQYRDMYDMFAKKAIEVSLFRPMLPGEEDILLAGNYHVHRANEEHGGEVTNQFSSVASHLVCFVGGMFGLGAKLFDRPQDMDIAKKLTDGCVWAYESTATGIMPESFEVLECASRTKCPWNQTRYNHALDPNSKSRFIFYDQQMEALEQEEKQEALEVAAAAGDIDAKVTMEQARRHQNQDATKNTKEEKIEPPPVIGSEKSKLVKRQNVAPAAAAAKGDFAEIADKVDLDTAPGPGASGSDSTAAKWKPEKPLSHEEYVKDRIESERLPPGMVSLGDRRYILR